MFQPTAAEGKAVTPALTPSPGATVGVNVSPEPPHTAATAYTALAMLLCIPPI